MKAEGKTADLNRKYSYGITPEQYREMCKRDPGCAICGCTDKALVVDHDHDTGKVRGRLCINCNTGIGKLGDTVANVMRAVKYLEERTC